MSNGEFSKGDEVVIKTESFDYIILYLFYKDKYLSRHDKRFEHMKAVINRDLRFLNGVVSHKLKNRGEDNYSVRFEYNGMFFYTPLNYKFLRISKRKIRDEKINELLDE